MKQSLPKLLVLIAFVTLSSVAFGQANQSQTFTLTLNNVIDIAVTGTPSATFDNATKYDNGIEVAGGANISIKSNKNWALNVKAAAATFSGGVIPISILGYKLSSGGSYTTITTSDVQVTTGNKGASNTATVDYKVTPGYTYDAGTYTLSVVYTATQQ